MVMKMNDLSIKFGKRIRQLRQSLSMSQEELAFKAGIRAAHLGQIERAEKKPTLETIGKLAEALSIPLNQLFALDEKPIEVSQSDNPIIAKINLFLTNMTIDEQKDALRIIRILHRYSKGK